MKNLIKKLFAIQKKRPTLSKDWKAVYWKYITLDNLIETYEPLLNEQGIVIIHRSVVWWIETKLIDQESCEEISSEIILPAWLTAQTTWSWITYAKRYNLWMLLNVIVNEDDDWQSAEKQNQAIKQEKVDNKEKSTITIHWLKPRLDKVQEKVDNKLEYPTIETFIAKISEKHNLTEEILQEINKFYSTILF